MQLAIPIFERLDMFLWSIKVQYFGPLLNKLDVKNLILWSCIIFYYEFVETMPTGMLFYNIWENSLKYSLSTCAWNLDRCSCIVSARPAVQNIWTLWISKWGKLARCIQATIVQDYGYPSCDAYQATPERYVTEVIHLLFVYTYVLSSY